MNENQYPAEALASASRSSDLITGRGTVGPCKQESKKMARELGSYLGNEASKPSELPACLHDLILSLDCHPKTKESPLDCERDSVKKCQHAVSHPSPF